MAYTDAAAVASFLGIALTSAQQTEAATQAAAASATIDRRTRRSWGTTGTITGEQHTLDGPQFYLRYPPVSAVSAVTLRWQWAGAPSDTLVSPSGYELVDPALGIVLVRTSYDPVFGAGLDALRDDYYGRLGRIAIVDYTSTAVPPDDIKRAATLLVALSLYTTLTESRIGETRINNDVETPAYDPKLWTEEVDKILTARRALVFA